MTGPPSVSGQAVTNKAAFADRTAWRALRSTNVNQLKDHGNASTGAVRVVQDSLLLDLPAELRTAIYELLLVSKSGWIEIGQVLKEPKLLSVCAQIRDEASIIFYKQNNFWYDARHARSVVLNEWSAKMAAANFTNLDVYVFLPTDVDEIDWLEGLIRWCRDIWADKDARTVVEGDGMDETESFMCKALALAENDEGKFEDWLDAKGHLEGLGLAVPLEVNINWCEYTFVDGFEYEAVLPEKTCWHGEEDRDLVDCRYCKLSPATDAWD